METVQEYRRLEQLAGMPGPSVVTRTNASEDPDVATQETIDLMRAAAIADSQSPQVYRATADAMKLTVGWDAPRVERCAAIYQWITAHVQFRSDEPTLRALFGLENELDLLIRPARLLTMNPPREDCDGFTMLACAMLLCAGVPCEMITIKADPEDASRFSHVYCQAILEDGRPLILDCSEGAKHKVPLGWEAPDYWQKETRGVLQPRRNTLHGLNNWDPGDWGGEAGPADVMGGSSSGFNWSSILGPLVNAGAKVAVMQGTPVGYVQTPTLTANYGQGVTPGLAIGAGGGIGTGAVLLGGGLLLAAIFLGGRK